MQFFNLSLLLLSILFIFSFISSPIECAPAGGHSEQDIEALMGLQDHVNEYLGSSNLNPAEKKKIEDMMAQKQAAIENSFGKK